MYKILVADDEEKIRALIRKYAEFEGHTVTEASNGMAAVRLCAENDFDIIVMDVMMPGVDGLAATRIIRSMSREDAKTIPIIAMTANAFSVMMTKRENILKLILTKSQYGSREQEIFSRQYLSARL